MADEISIVVKAEDQFSSTLGNFGNILTGIKSGIDMVSDGFKMFAGLAMEGLDAIASYERMGASLETLTAKEIMAAGAAGDMNQALKMAAPIAEELLKWNQQLAINSPFTAEGVNNAFRMAMAYGFTIEESKRLTEALIDFAAGSGASEAAMEAIARALGQISATGKVTGGDMMQLVNAGLPVVEILAAGFNVTTAELMDMRSKGLLPATEAIEYITKYLEENFAGAAERQANTWAGLQGTFEDIKQMGLREFFGGMFEALQPLAVELSAFLQNEGMAKLSEWGEALGGFTKGIIELVSGGKLYELGYQLQQIAGKDSFFYALGTSIRIFQQALDDGKSVREAFIEGLQKLSDLTGVDFDFSKLLDQLDVELAAEINQGIALGKFRQSGDAFGRMIESVLTGGIEGQESRAIPAIGQAISQWFEGAVGSVYFDHSALEIITAFGQVLTDEGTKIGQRLGASMRAWFKEVGESAKQGLLDGFTAIDQAISQWAWDHIVIPIRKLFGIASPSTVFMEIGKNLVQGLWDGMSDMWTSFTTWVSDKFTALLGNISPENIFKIITGQMTVAELFGSSSGGGSVPYSPGGYGPGGYTPPATGTTGTASGTGAVNYYFYGPVYFGTDMGSTDCPTPHPLIAASGNTLITSGIG